MHPNRTTIATDPVSVRVATSRSCVRRCPSEPRGPDAVVADIAADMTSHDSLSLTLVDGTDSCARRDGAPRLAPLHAAIGRIGSILQGAHPVRLSRTTRMAIQS